MPRHKIEFGVYLPQLGFTYPQIRERAQTADRLGYHSIWFMDHFYPPAMPTVPSFEAWTTVSSLAMVTERIRLGHLVMCNGFRHPALLAKMATSLDVISNGRLELGIGTGSVPPEHKQFDVYFPPFRERIERLEESVLIIKSLFTQEETNFKGKYYTLEKAPNLPKPMQKPHPPITIGGGGEKYTLPLVAREADAWNCPTYSLGELEKKIAVLRGECAKIGRNPATLRLTEEAVLAIAKSKADLPGVIETAKRRYPGKGWGLEASGYIGTPDDIIKRIKERAAMGISLFAFFFYDRADPATLELFAKEVMPAFA